MNLKNSSHLTLVKNKNIDRSLYDKCINDSNLDIPYAESWFLDVVVDYKWDCLIYGNYEIVMPLPHQYFFGIKFITLPPFCQQLGIFYSGKISPDIAALFIDYIKRQKVRGYSFNVRNVLDFDIPGQKLQNHILNLNTPYVQIFENFSKDRKKEIQKSSNNIGVIQQSNNINKFIELIQSQYNYTNSTKYFNTLQRLVDYSHKKKSGYLLEYRLEETICNYRFIYKGNKKLFILASARVKNKKYDGTSTALINFLIKNKADQFKYLDFEGSDFKGVARFNESLGARPEIYHYYKNNYFIDRIKNLYIKIKK